MKKVFATLIVVFCFVLTLVACAKVEPKVTFMVDGEVHTVTELSKVKDVTQPEKEGFVFEGWFLDNNEWQKPFVAEDVTADCTVYAKLVSDGKFELKFENCEEYGIPKSIRYEHGEVVDLPVIGNGINFLGWLAEDGSGPFTKIVVEKDMKFTPVFGILDRIYVDTNGAPILDKENYVPATFTMIDKNGDVVKDFKDVSTGIRLRGNSTNNLAKKPYRLKFDKKQALLGENKYKSWVLLALAEDPTLMKNFSAQYLASQLDGIGVKLRTKHVQVFVNGEDRGVYLLTDQIQEQPEGSVGRVPIEIDEEELAEMTEVPFLLERDWYPEGVENKNWFNYQYGKTKYTMQIKYPDEPTEEQFNFIYNTYDNACKLFVELENAIEEEKADIRLRIAEKVDINSVIDYFMVIQIMHDFDNGGSMYMYYDMDKLKFGPVWDFDAAFTNSYGFDSRFSKSYEAAERELVIIHEWYGIMRKDSAFNNLICERFDKYGKKAMNNLIEHLDSYMDEIYYEAMKNILMWSDGERYTSGYYLADYYKNYGDYSGAKTYVISWFEKRLDFLTELYKLS